MTDKDAYELRADLDYWLTKVDEYAGEFLQAVDAEDFDWAAGVRVALEQARAQVRHVRAQIRVGAAA